MHQRSSLKSVVPSSCPPHSLPPPDVIEKDAQAFAVVSCSSDSFVSDVCDHWRLSLRSPSWTSLKGDKMDTLDSLLSFLFFSFFSFLFFLFGRSTPRLRVLVLCGYLRSLMLAEQFGVCRSWPCPVGGFRSRAVSGRQSASLSAPPREVVFAGTMPFAGRC